MAKRSKQPKAPENPLSIHFIKESEEEKRGKIEGGKEKEARREAQRRWIASILGSVVLTLGAGRGLQEVLDFGPVKVEEETVEAPELIQVVQSFEAISDLPERALRDQMQAFLAENDRDVLSEIDKAGFFLAFSMIRGETTPEIAEKTLWLIDELAYELRQMTQNHSQARVLYEMVQHHGREINSFVPLSELLIDSSGGSDLRGNCLTRVMFDLSMLQRVFPDVPVKIQDFVGEVEGGPGHQRVLVQLAGKWYHLENRSRLEEVNLDDPGVATYDANDFFHIFLRERVELNMPTPLLPGDGQRPVEPGEEVIDYEETERLGGTGDDLFAVSRPEGMTVTDIATVPAVADQTEAPITPPFELPMTHIRRVQERARWSQPQDRADEGATESSFSVQLEYDFNNGYEGGDREEQVRQIYQRIRENYRERLDGADEQPGRVNEHGDILIRLDGLKDLTEEEALVFLESDETQALLWEAQSNGFLLSMYFGAEPYGNIHYQANDLDRLVAALERINVGSLHLSPGVDTLAPLARLNVGIIVLQNPVADLDISSLQNVQLGFPGDLQEHPMMALNEERTRVVELTREETLEWVIESTLDQYTNNSRQSTFRLSAIPGRLPGYEHTFGGSSLPDERLGISTEEYIFVVSEIANRMGIGRMNSLREMSIPLNAVSEPGRLVQELSFVQRIKLTNYRVGDDVTSLVEQGVEVGLEDVGWYFSVEDRQGHQFTHEDYIDENNIIRRRIRRSEIEQADMQDTFRAMQQNSRAFFESVDDPDFEGVYVSPMFHSFFEEDLRDFMNDPASIQLFEEISADDTPVDLGFGMIEISDLESLAEMFGDFNIHSLRLNTSATNLATLAQMRIENLYLYDPGIGTDVSGINSLSNHRLQITSASEAHSFDYSFDFSSADTLFPILSQNGNVIEGLTRQRAIDLMRDHIVQNVETLRSDDVRYDDTMYLRMPINILGGREDSHAYFDTQNFELSEDEYFEIVQALVDRHGPAVLAEFAIELPAKYIRNFQRLVEDFPSIKRVSVSHVNDGQDLSYLIDQDIDVSVAREFFITSESVGYVLPTGSRIITIDEEGIVHFRPFNIQFNSPPSE